MDYQRLCIPDVRQIRTEDQGVGHFASGFHATSDAKGHHSTIVSYPERLLGQFVIRMGWQAKVGYPLNLWVFLKPSECIVNPIS